MGRRDWIVCWLGIVIGLARIIMGFAVPLSASGSLWFQTYKDFAHIYVGALFALWMVEGKGWQQDLFWGLCVVEILVAILTRV